MLGSSLQKIRTFDSVLFVIRWIPQQLPLRNYLCTNCIPTCRRVIFLFYVLEAWRFDVTSPTQLQQPSSQLDHLGILHNNVADQSQNKSCTQQVLSQILQLQSGLIIFPCGLQILVVLANSRHNKYDNSGYFQAS